MLRSHHHALHSIYDKRLCDGGCWNMVTGVTWADKARDVCVCVWLVCSILGGVGHPWVLLVLGGGGLRWWFGVVSGTHVRLGLYHLRVLMCKCGDVRGLFHVADKAGIEICRTSIWCVYHCGAGYYEWHWHNLILHMEITMGWRLVCWFSLCCWILCVALIQSCVAYGDHCLGIYAVTALLSWYLVLSSLVCFCKNYPLLCGCFVLTSEVVYGSL